MGILQKESLKKKVIFITAIAALFVLAACNEAQEPSDARRTIEIGHKILLTVPPTQNVSVNADELEVFTNALAPQITVFDVDIWQRQNTNEPMVQIVLKGSMAEIDITQNPNSSPNITSATVAAAILTASDVAREHTQETGVVKVTRSEALNKVNEYTALFTNDENINPFDIEPAD